jgi:hypothetical protein
MAMVSVSPPPELRDILDEIDLAAVTVPSLLLAAESDVATTPARTEKVFDGISSAEKAYVLLSDAVHRSFASGLCNIMQASGAIVQGNPVRAILDRQTLNNLLNPVVNNLNGSTLDYCGFESFTTPVDIRPIVKTLTGVNVTTTNVPRLGTTSTAVKNLVSELAVDFFEAMLNCRHEARYLDAEFRSQYDAMVFSFERQQGPTLCPGANENDSEDRLF